MHTKNNQLNLPPTPTRRGAGARAYPRVLARVVTASLSLSLLVGGILPSVALAATQAYSTQDATISRAMAVAVVGSDSQTATDNVTVEKSSIGKANKTLGVVVDPNTDTVAIGSTGNQVYVATSGAAQVYVTDLNGVVRKGDLLAPSPLTGVLMRAVDGSKGILGVAVTDFSSQISQTVSIDEPGGPTDVKVGLVTINMDTKFTTNTPNVTKSLLQRTGEAIVGHEVSIVQAMIALAILLLLIVVVGGIVYGAISSSIVSLGRNPLAQGTIMKGLIQVTFLVTGVLGLGIAAVYLVLWI